jgi:formate--tetrahydrofolate ligase
VVATKMALKLADYVVTEAGFGADLGAEKFFDIKCRLAGLKPSATVLVVTNRAYKLHGMENILKHAENVRLFGVPVVVSINKFLEDPLSDLEDLKKKCEDNGVEAVITDFREAGGDGGLELAEKISAACKKKSGFKTLYELEKDIKEKIEIIATRIYGADKVEYSAEANQKIKQIKTMGLSQLPICMAKTPASLSDNPHKPGRPVNFTINVSGAKVSSGAGFIVIYTGNVMTMPGLPKEPAALSIDIDRKGTISGLF